MTEMTIYHGSNKEIIKPLKNLGKSYNDFGQGFYCTLYYDLAAQWACKLQEDGIVNEYVLNVTGLDILRLDEKFNILNWLAILIDNREFSGNITSTNARYIIDNYLIDYKKYDVIIGYRADDAYFRFIREFLNNSTGLNTLNEAMYLGKLGLQIFIQSDKAFNQLEFVKSSVEEQEIHYIKNVLSIDKACETYELLKIKNELNDIYIHDIKGGKINENSIPKIKIK